ncbi:MAG: hypothetical protein ACRDOH_22760 [Streptosporangiaceae bacterium]
MTSSADEEFVPTYLVGGQDRVPQHAAELAGPYQDSVLRVEVMDAWRSAPGVIVGHGETELDLVGQIRGTVLTLAAGQRPGLWRVAAAHNSIVVPR